MLPKLRLVLAVIAAALAVGVLGVGLFSRHASLFAIGMPTARSSPIERSLPQPPDVRQFIALAAARRAEELNRLLELPNSGPAEPEDHEVVAPPTPQVPAPSAELQSAGPQASGAPATAFHSDDAAPATMPADSSGGRMANLPGAPASSPTAAQDITRAEPQAAATAETASPGPTAPAGAASAMEESATDAAGGAPSGGAAAAAVAAVTALAEIKAVGAPADMTAVEPRGSAEDPVATEASRASDRSSLATLDVAAPGVAVEKPAVTPIPRPRPVSVQKPAHAKAPRSASQRHMARTRIIRTRRVAAPSASPSPGRSAPFGFQTNLGHQTPATPNEPSQNY